MLNIRLKRDIVKKQGIMPTKEENDALGKIEKEEGKDGKEIRTKYFTIRAKLLGETGYCFDETAGDATAKLLNLLKDILEPCSAGKKQESSAEAVDIGAVASTDAVEALKEEGVSEGTAIAEEQKWVTLRITEKEALVIKPLLEKLIQAMRKWLPKGVIRGAIVEIHEKKEDCRMARLLAGARKEHGAIEAQIIISQCHNFYRTVLAMNKEIKEGNAPKHPIQKALLLTKSEKTKVTFMADLGKKYVLMLETPIIKRALIFMEMEETMQKILNTL